MDVLPSRISQYEIRGVLGKGGMGIVYLAFDPGLHRLVALKVLRTDSDDQRERFRREARIVARLQHPNIVAIYTVGEHEQQPFIAMEYIDGEPLSEAIRRRATWGLQRKLMIGADLCAGLAFAHRAGVIHRDVKPSNLIVSHKSGAVRLLDFGIARGADAGATLGLTMHGNIVGTLNYMSPEQITGQPIDHRSDIFAVGLVLYELVTYRQAFSGDNLATLTYRIVHGSPDPIRSLQPDANEQLCQVIERAMARRPDDRYPHLDALRSDLLRIAGHLSPAQATQIAGTLSERIVVGGAPPIWSHALDVTADATGPVTPQSTARVPEDVPAAGSTQTSRLPARLRWPVALMVGGLALGGGGGLYVALQPATSRPSPLPASGKQTPGEKSAPVLPPHIQEDPRLAAQPPVPAAPDEKDPAPTASVAAPNNADAKRRPTPPPATRQEPARTAAASRPGATPTTTAGPITARTTEPATIEAARNTDSATPLRDAPAPAPSAAAPIAAPIAAPSASSPQPQQPPAAPSDQQQVQALLTQWARAYTARDARGVDEVQPGSAATLEKQFADLRNVHVTLSACRLDVQGARASAECAEEFAAETRFGGRTSTARRRHFTLQKSAAGWRITASRVGR